MPRNAPDEAQGYAQMQAVSEVWNKKYPGSMNRWADNWDVISPMFSRRPAPDSPARCAR